MAARLSLDDKLAAIRKLRGQPISAEHHAALRKYIGDRSNLVVAAAAAIAGESAIIELAADLEASFDRFLGDPLKDDKLCRAKIAIVQALDKMEYQKAEIFRESGDRRAARAGLGRDRRTPPRPRAASLVAMARIEGRGALPMLVDAMTDPAKDVRIASAVALGAVGTEAAGLLLRLKIRLGDRDPEVLSECLSGLLAVDPKEYSRSSPDSSCRPTRPDARRRPSRWESRACPRRSSRSNRAGRGPTRQALSSRSCWTSPCSPALGDQLSG